MTTRVHTQPMCIICWSRGGSTPATVFVDPGWYCDECAVTVLPSIAEASEFQRGVRLGLALSIVAVLVALLVLVVVTTVF